MAAPLHVPLSRPTCWNAGWHAGPPKDIAEAVVAAALPDGQPRQRTVFTPIALNSGLPPRLAYMQVNDLVLWKGIPHFVYTIGAPTCSHQSEVLFRTAAMHGRDRGIANPMPPARPSYLSDVVYEIEPPAAEHIAWAHAAAAAAKAGTPTEALPLPPPPPPVWRSLCKDRVTCWGIDARAAGLTGSIPELKMAVVVTWKGNPYFVKTLQDKGEACWGSGLSIILHDPARFAVPSLGGPEVRLTLPDRPPAQDPVDPTARFPTLPEEREEQERRVHEYEETLGELNAHLAIADAEVAEAARVAADAAFAAAPIEALPVAVPPAAGSANAAHAAALRVAMPPPPPRPCPSGQTSGRGSDQGFLWGKRLSVCSSC